MSKIYTQIGAGGSSTQDRAVALRELIESNDLGRVSAGDIVQANLGWSAKPGRLYRNPAETVLEVSPHHPESIETSFTHEGDPYTKPGHRGVVRNAIEKVPNPKAIYFDYEPYPENYSDGTPRFDLAFRRFTEAEMDLAARCIAIEKSEMYRYTGKACKAGVWNTPAYVLDERTDWGAVREFYTVTGLDLFLINDYKYDDSPSDGYITTTKKIEKVRQEMPDHIEPVVCLTSSLKGDRWEEATTASIIHKALATREAGVDAMWWTNADWFIESTRDKYQEHTHALGGVFGGA